jgi:hypothetical protein
VQVITMYCVEKMAIILLFHSKHTMPTKTGNRKSAKSDDENKKKDSGKSTKKNADDVSGALIGSNEPGSSSHDK